MTARFDSRADWPGALPGEETGLDVESCAVAASALARQWFPVAARTCGVGEWARRAAAEHGSRLVTGLAAGAIAADHFAARIPCPRKVSSRWLDYLRLRVQAARDAMPAVLARWAVMECIPRHWVPAEAVCAQIQGRLARAGFGAEVIESRIAPPGTDGIDSVRQSCDRDTRDAWQRARRQPLAVVVHRMGQVEACVVSWTDGGGYRAFGLGLAACGRTVGLVDVVAAAPLECADPPVGTLVRHARALGIGELVWAVNRVFRIWTGGHRDAALR